ncbi:hypothetical protein MED193_16969 [Roseobacter sp. MED193]|uniref:trypsin-like serine protease n=1 Tax=Roseobacter sp. MED193 TaxID=314262 RepID=UPI000068B7A6|nr:trypsin-like serine protease [Roseobacter sp. MED193]EAQ46905.1 hypothetical protein MED193_16969 [Roseobacter sp. MED193]
MTRTALNLFLCLALALPISTAAQDFAISDRASAEEQAMLEALIARAEEASGAGTPDYDPSVYYATLETGLMRLMGQAGAEARSASVLSLDPSTIHASDAAIERVSDDTELQDSLNQIVERIRAGLRVIGGQTAKAGQFTSAVALVSGNNNTGCSGVVIEAGWILTAAHCYCDFRLDQDRVVRAVFANPVITQSTDDAFVLKGEMMDDDFCDKRDSGSICSPDLALLRYTVTDTPDYVIPAKIADAAEAAAHVAVGGTRGSLLVGFGATRPQSSTSGVGAPWSPQRANPKTWGLIPRVLSCKKAKSCTAGNDPRGCALDIDVEMMDATARTPGDVTDACHGDSGGPVYLPRSATDNPRIFAITSRAADQNGHCGEGAIYPKVYTQSVRNWIDDAKGRLSQ